LVEHCSWGRKRTPNTQKDPKPELRIPPRLRRWGGRKKPGGGRGGGGAIEAAWTLPNRPFFISPPKTARSRNSMGWRERWDPVPIRSLGPVGSWLSPGSANPLPCVLRIFPFLPPTSLPWELLAAFPLPFTSRGQNCVCGPEDVGKLKTAPFRLSIICGLAALGPGGRAAATARVRRTLSPLHPENRAFVLVATARKKIFFLLPRLAPGWRFDSLLSRLSVIILRPKSPHPASLEQKGKHYFENRNPAAWLGNRRFLSTTNSNRY